jgi:hypothetical protein
MATKNIVPNADSEGGIGTSSKYWATGFIDAITTTGNLVVGGNVTSNDLILTAGTLFGTGNTGFSNRSSDTTLYLQMPATGFNITDDSLNTRFILSSGGDVNIGSADGLPLMHGSVAANASYCTYSFVNDQNTGMIRTGADTLALVTAGSPKLTIASSGLVTLDSSIVLDDNEGLFWGATSGSNEYIVNNGSDLILGTAGSSRLTITSGGLVQVGDGTSSNTFLTTKSLAGYISGIKLTRGLGDGSNTNNNNFGMLVTDGGWEVSTFTSPLDNTTGRSVKLIISNGGDVGIGTDSPVGKFEIKSNAGTITTSPAITFTDDSGVAGSARWIMGNIATSYGNFVLAVSDAVNTVNYTPKLTITSEGAANFAGSVTNAHMMTIINSKSTPYGIYQRFMSEQNNESSDFIRFQDGTEVKFYVYSNGNVKNKNNSYSAISDVKLKENIVDTPNKLNDILKVKVRNYNFKNDHLKQIGVIAQELESIFPSLVSESPDTEIIDKKVVDLGTTTKSVKYSVFVPILIKAMQEQQTIIEDLKSRIETLEG